VVVHEAIEPSTRAVLDSVPSIHKVFTNYDGSITFLQISLLSLADSASDDFFILHDVGIKTPGSDASRPTRLVPLPRHLQALIHIPLGFVNMRLNMAALCSPAAAPAVGASQDHLVFLSNEGWISTMFSGGVI
jgi:hypothetical protein